MRSDIATGAIFSLTTNLLIATAKRRKLSELQEQHPIGSRPQPRALLPQRPATS